MITQEWVRIRMCFKWVGVTIYRAASFRNPIVLACRMTPISWNMIQHKGGGDDRSSNSVKSIIDPLSYW